MYKSQFPQKSCRHLAHLSSALPVSLEQQRPSHRYRPVGLTPSGTGCLASGTISISHPKHSGTASGESSRSSSVTTPNLATGKSNQKLDRQLTPHQRALPTDLLAKCGLLTTMRLQTSQSVGTSHNLLPHLGHRYPPFFINP